MRLLPFRPCSEYLFDIWIATRTAPLERQTQRKSIGLRPNRLPVLQKQGGSNGLLRNALTHVLLSGPLNKHHLDSCLQQLQEQDGGQHLVLLRGSQNHAFKGLYKAHSSDWIGSVYGSGPSVFDKEKVKCWYKYDSGRRAFIEVPTKELVGSICAVVLEPTRS